MHSFWRNSTPAKPAAEQDSKTEGPFFQDRERTAEPETNGAFFQPQLKVGGADDPLESEADAVAERVVNGQPTNTIGNNVGSGTSSSVNRNGGNDAGFTASANFSARVNANKGGGRTLPEEIRSEMEEGIGADFSGVRVHTGSDATELNENIGARAFTHGSDIYFGSGAYQRGNTAGKRLLAHELTHTVQQGSSGEVVRRFGSLEHKSLGDEGSQGAAVTYSSTTEKSAKATGGEEKLPFRLTFGDFVMLSGDYFDPRDTIKDPDTGKDIVNPDSLFRMVKRPSGNPGQELGTRDEVIYAIKEINAKDPRFVTDTGSTDPRAGEWADIKFSKAVKDSVKNRYLRLAGNNLEHFVHPEAGVDGGTLGLGKSAGGSYLSLHEEAIMLAFHSGQNGKDIGEALTREAAAQHFLTDYFAAGHLRTPRASIRTFWRGKFPLFFGNLKKKIALDMAIYMNANTNNVTTALGTVTQIYDGVYGKVKEQTKNLPELGFDDIVSLVLHDFDNEQGLAVTNDLGYEWQLFGDGFLDKKHPNNMTREMAQMAVFLGVKDIRNAYASGKTNSGDQPAAAVYEVVKQQATAPAVAGDKFAPLQIVPFLDPLVDDGTQNWKADTIDELWDLPVRTDKAATVGEEIEKSVITGELAHKLAGMAADIPLIEKRKTGDLKPREGFEKGFLAPLQSNPKKGLKEIINYNPSEGQAGFNTDDAVMEEMDSMTTDEIKGFTISQRLDRIKNLLSGPTFGDEEDRIVELFATTDAESRRKLYFLVEGHKWNGDWVQGWFTDDDDLWNDLTKGRLNKLKKLLNE